jgi:hypothetical protein
MVFLNFFGDPADQPGVMKLTSTPHHALMHDSECRHETRRFCAKFSAISCAWGKPTERARAMPGPQQILSPLDFWISVSLYPWTLTVSCLGIPLSGRPAGLTFPHGCFP